VNRVVVIYVGVVVTVVASLFGLVLIPESQLTSIQPKTVALPDGREVVYPQPLDSWREAPGKRLYEGYGCIYCHSQQVRPSGFGADLDRGWGTRRSTPRDYLYDRPPLLGTMRTGPDLANIAGRNPSREWHLLHLYDPQITSPGSIMPPFGFLFEETAEEPDDPEAVRLPEDYRDVPAWIIPSREALELVAYIRRLRQPHALEDVQ
jgi:cytochrome c oxidase cbb3-type subunit 2